MNGPRKGKAKESEQRRARAAARPATERARRPAAEPEPHARARGKDEARTLALLWGAQDRPARSGLSVPSIVSAAIELADREGIAALSMRRLAEILDVGTMSLYTHVPGKAELLDLMFDAVMVGLYEDIDEPRRQDGYRAGIEFIAEHNRKLFQAHPWLLDLHLARPVLGPNACTKYEAELRVLDGIGLTDVEIDSVASQLLTHIFASCRYAEEERRAQQDTGLTEMEWWARTLPVLKSVMSGEFPVASRVGPAANEAIAPMTSTEHHFRWGVEVVVQTVATLVRGRESAGKM
jgi:AcrR family transcriptional regulator